MIILYGTILYHYNVTKIAHSLLYDNNIIYIPANDDIRSSLFSDPVYGTLKKIYIIKDKSEYIYNHNDSVYIDITTNIIYTQDNVPESVLNSFEHRFNKLIDMHKKLKIHHGSLYCELPEQLMAMKYITGNEKVLELGGNIGRNSILIAYILNKNNNTNLVSLECDKNIAKQLTENRDINLLKFHIESSALSNRKLIQRGWDTIVSDVVLEGYKPVNTITLDELHNKYNIIFDTLILDCEGAFYYILMDMPEILNNINLIIMENDYKDISYKKYIDSKLLQNGFSVAFSSPGGFCKSYFVCHDNFFEVWIRP